MIFKQLHVIVTILLFCFTCRFVYCGNLSKQNVKCEPFFDQLQVILMDDYLDSDSSDEPLFKQCQKYHPLVKAMANLIKSLASDNALCSSNKVKLIEVYQHRAILVDDSLTKEVFERYIDVLANSCLEIITQVGQESVQKFILASIIPAQQSSGSSFGLSIGPVPSSYGSRQSTSRIQAFKDFLPKYRIINNEDSVSSSWYNQFEFELEDNCQSQIEDLVTPAVEVLASLTNENVIDDSVIKIDDKSLNSLIDVRKVCLFYLSKFKKSIISKQQAKDYILEIEVNSSKGFGHETIRTTRYINPVFNRKGNQRAALEKKNRHNDVIKNLMSIWRTVRNISCRSASVDVFVNFQAAHKSYSSDIVTYAHLFISKCLREIKETFMKFNVWFESKQFKQYEIDYYTALNIFNANSLEVISNTSELKVGNAVLSKMSNLSKIHSSESTFELFNTENSSTAQDLYTDPKSFTDSIRDFTELSCNEIFETKDKIKALADLETNLGVEVINDKNINFLSIFRSLIVFHELCSNHKQKLRTNNSVFGKNKSD